MNFIADVVLTRQSHARGVKRLADYAIGIKLTEPTIAQILCYSTKL